MIKLEGISKNYQSIFISLKNFPFKKDNVIALKDVNLCVREGDILALLGPNGAGKTTLLKILATLITPDEGSATICGYDLIRSANRIKSLIGIVNTNDRSFYWRLTTRQNLDFFGSLFGLKTRQKQKIIEKLLRAFDLDGVADRQFMTLSSGQKQKVALARALLSSPKILLLDEPTTSLDPISSQEFIDIIKRFILSSKKITMIWCTHNLEEAQRTCNCYCILNRGRIVQKGAINADISLARIFKEAVCSIR